MCMSSGRQQSVAPITQLPITEKEVAPMVNPEETDAATAASAQTPRNGGRKKLRIDLTSGDGGSGLNVPV